MPRGGDRTGTKRVLRGGSRNNDSRKVRVATGNPNDPDNANIGLRLARAQTRGGSDRTRPDLRCVKRHVASENPERAAAWESLSRTRTHKLAGFPPLDQHVSERPLDGGDAPSWACAWGDDRYGVYATLRVKGVEHRLRWIPPGRFEMGSPEDEAGRCGDEEPAWSERQHEVVLTRGYWLGETPVTQSLWATVMGKNPSRFKSSDRPVEQVSWLESMKFVERLNAGVPGLDARLPTEAEWEHACRAGTKTATWAGDLDILGDNHAPVLAPIAWYGGNSGVSFDLAEGYDSSGWPAKEFRHTKAGTRIVGQKSSNPWGLYDMLGNVWEWCSDWHAPYEMTPAVDPAVAELGTVRVLRGGSWNNYARLVRAASRYAFDPGSANGVFGLRLARGHSALQRPGEPRGTTGESRRRP